MHTSKQEIIKTVSLVKTGGKTVKCTPSPILYLSSADPEKVRGVQSSHHHFDSNVQFG